MQHRGKKIEVDQEARVSYDFITKINEFFFNKHLLKFIKSIFI